MDIITDNSADELRSYLDLHLNSVEDNDAINVLIGQNIEPLLTLFKLPKKETLERVSIFIRHYISIAPDYLNAYQTLAKIGGIEEYTHAFIHAALQFFSSKHPVVDAAQGLSALLCKAYLFHRILEELNDRIELERQWALIPADIVQTNLIAHTLIGDEQANLLDQTVLIHLEIINTQRTAKAHRLFQQKDIIALTAQLKDKGWQETYSRWPFLKEDISEVFYNYTP